MKAIYINPFLQAASHILNQFQMTCSVGKPNLRDTPVSGQNILTVVGVSGDLRGQVYLGIPTTTALKIVSKMMGGVEITDLDAMAQSAICELNNMICGNALIRFSENGLSLDITPPTLIMGDKLEIASTKMKVLSVPVLIEGTDGMEMNIVFETPEAA